MKEKLPNQSFDFAYKRKSLLSKYKAYRINKNHNKIVLSEFYLG